jgi:RNA polymerase sigma-70 factor (ECF subfamily)
MKETAPWGESVVSTGETFDAGQLIDRFHGRIYAFLRRLSGTDSDAVELTQRTFCRVWVALPGFAGKSTVSSWLHGIAYRTYVDWLRKERRSQAMPDEWWTCLPDEQAGPDDLSAASHDRSVIFRAVDRLEPELRDTIHLHYYQGLSIEETGRALEIASSTVKHRVRRALDLLRRTVANPHPLPASISARTSHE